MSCTVEFYDADVSTTVAQSTHTVQSNTTNTIVITPAISSDITLANGDYIHIRGYGAPCVGEKNGSVARLNADNLLGLLETGTFPNLEVEMKQLNLSLGGSRNFTHQYKGIETASGGSLAVVANHGIGFNMF